MDIAPLAISQVPAYLTKYAKDGAHQITTDVVDLLSILWSPASVLADPGKAAAIAEYIPRWAKGLVWVYENPDRWIQDYYVKTQNLTSTQARASPR